jgi:hypothetical protein
MANELFRSPWIVAQPLNDKTFQPQSWSDALIYPWHWLLGDRTPGAEIPIRDPRYAVVLSAAVWCILTARSKSAEAMQGAGARLLLGLFILLSYLVWLFLFGILRYAVMLEMLSGVLLLAALRSFPRLSTKAGLGALIAVALISIASTRTTSWGRAASPAIGSALPGSRRCIGPARSTLCPMTRRLASWSRCSRPMRVSCISGAICRSILRPN